MRCYFICLKKDLLFTVLSFLDAFGLGEVVENVCRMFIHQLLFFQPYSCRTCPVVIWFFLYGHPYSVSAVDNVYITSRYYYINMYIYIAHIYIYMIAQSVRTFERNSVFVGSNLPQANFLKLLQKSFSGEYYMYRFMPLLTWLPVRDFA